MKGTPTARGKKNPVTVQGPWLPMSLNFLRSRACAELSPQATKMLIDLCSQLGGNAKGNGDVSAAPAIMRPKGWTGDATRTAALKELEDAGLVSITRRGHRRQCNLYAIALWPIDCDVSKLDHGPGSFTTSDWEKVSADRADPPTKAAPAKWKRPRKSTISAPATGQPPSVMSPPRDNPLPFDDRFDPATRTKEGFSGLMVIPPRDTFLEGHLLVPAGCALAGVRSAVMA